MGAVADEKTDGLTTETALDEKKKTILIYSPDLNFCFSLSMVFQDQYSVITTTNSGMLETFVSHYSADLVILDAMPTEKLLQRLHELKSIKEGLPIIMVYVFRSKDLDLDRDVRLEVDSVFYKPFDLASVSSRVNELLRP
jgi:DNA-binding response OmpR family regulator